MPAPPMMGTCPAPGCGKPLTVGWPPFCPRDWLALPGELADAVRYDALAIIHGEASAAFDAARAWLGERNRERVDAYAAIGRRMQGEGEQ